MSEKRDTPKSGREDLAKSSQPPNDLVTVFNRIETLEKRVPYWEFMRQGLNNLNTPKSGRELSIIIQSMQKEIDERNEVIDQLRNDIKRVEKLLESHGIKRT